PSQITSGGGSDICPAVTPDGRGLAFNVDVTWLPLFQLATDGSPPRRISAGLEDVSAINVSPDGGDLVLGIKRDGEIFIVVRSVTGGSERVLGEGTKPVWSPDGREVAWVDLHAQRIVAVPRAGGTPRTVAEAAFGVGYMGVGDDDMLYVVPELPNS